jgi:hypothetical protein
VIAQSVQRWATGWTIGFLGFDSRRGLEIFLFTTASRTALGPTHPHIQWVQGVLSLGVKRPGREADHSPHLVPRSKNECGYISTPPIRLIWRGVRLNQRDNFTFYNILRHKFQQTSVFHKPCSKINGTITTWLISLSNAKFRIQRNVTLKPLCTS